MKNIVVFLSLICPLITFSQKDSLQLGDRYLEDQLYIGITYNVFLKQPSNADESGFSFGVSTGYIKDIPFNRKGKWAAGIGLGYNYGTFSHDLLIDSSDNFSIDALASLNRIRLHNIEMPIQLRWRDSDSVTYSFWRVYAGVRLSYNIANTFKYTVNNQNFRFTDVGVYNKFQTGLELSVGYGVINFFVYYGLTPMYKNAFINKEAINTKIAKFGLIFYLL